MTRRLKDGSGICRSLRTRDHRILPIKLSMLAEQQQETEMLSAEKTSLVLQPR